MSPSEIVMTVYVVYQDPKDLPYRFAVRAQYVIQGRLDPVNDQEWWAVAQDEEQLHSIRNRLAEKGLTPLPRYPNDDPAIIETWI